MFEQRHCFLYKARTEIECFGIRKRHFHEIRKEHDYFVECMKINFMYNYNLHIRIPLNRKKKFDIEMN